MSREHDHLVVALDLLERAREHELRVVAVAAEVLLVGAHDARGRVEQPLARRVVARPAQQRADRVLGLRAGGARGGEGLSRGLARGLGHRGLLLRRGSGRRGKPAAAPIGVPEA